MNQRNPFMMQMQPLHAATEPFKQPVHYTEPEIQPVSVPVTSLRENQLLAELAFERKRYAEIELALLNQKVGATQVLIQNFEMKAQQLKRDLATYTNDIADKKKEIERLSLEYEARKKLMSESS
jgi:hypothetical protein